MINIKKYDSTLLMLSLISVANIIIMFFLDNFIYIKYILLFLTFVIVISENTEKILPTLFFLHPNSALYDDIGFTYLFNISVFIFMIKLLVFNNEKMNKKLFLQFSLIFIWELLLIFKAGVINESILSLVSWVSSYIILIILSKKDDIKFTTIYKYFFLGFLFAFICGWSTPIKEWGIANIPTAYRFIGLLRDPNYYTVDALLLIFGSFIYVALSGKKRNIYIILSCIMGICSVSKSFIILLIFGMLLKIICSLKKINLLKIIVVLFLLISCIFVFYKLGYIELFFEKYLYRSETTSLFTGRDKLFTYFITCIFNSPLSFLFGNGALTYPIVLNAGIIDKFFTNFVAHNTYLDIILAWGVLGTLVYFNFIFNVIKNSKVSLIKTKYDFDCKITITVFLVSLFTLSYLTTDVFALIILYMIIMVKSVKKSQKKLEE